MLRYNTKDKEPGYYLQNGERNKEPKRKINPSAPPLPAWDMDYENQFAWDRLEDLYRRD